MSLRQRVPTSIVLLGIVFLVIQYAARWVFFVFLQIIILAALLEFYGLARKKRLFPQRALGILLAMLISLSFWLEEMSLEQALFLGLLLAAVYFLIIFNKIEKLSAFPCAIATTFFGAFYLSFTLNHFYPLKIEGGPRAIYFLFVVIFLGDTGAYFLGTALGRHKMTPVASPNKTWEGSFGGIVFACLGAIAAQQLFLRAVPIWKAALSGILIHAVAQASDPLESLFKRAVGVKDSSNLLPGHGGFLDRVDSLILAAPFFYYFIRYFWK
jgi:phosphatidate cytidylyltransferase